MAEAIAKALPAIAELVGFDLGASAGVGLGGGFLANSGNFLGDTGGGGTTDSTTSSSSSGRATTTSSSSRSFNSGGSVTGRQTVSDEKTYTETVDDVLADMWPAGVGNRNHIDAAPVITVPSHRPDYTHDHPPWLDNREWDPHRGWDRSTGLYGEPLDFDSDLKDIDFEDGGEDDGVDYDAKGQEDEGEVDLNFDDAAEEVDRVAPRHTSRKLMGWGTTATALGLIVGGAVGGDAAKTSRKPFNSHGGEGDGGGGGGGGGGGDGSGGGTRDNTYKNLGDQINRGINGMYDQHGLEDRIENQKERLLSLRPFLATAGTDLFDVQEDEESDKLKMSNLAMGMTPYNPLGILDNKLALSQMVTDGLRYSGDLFALPIIYSGGTLTNGATLYGTIRKTPASIDQSEFRPLPTSNKRMRLR